MNILLVEDSPGDARLLSEMFREQASRTIAVTHVTSMGEAERHVSAHLADVIILDLGLPDAKGLDAVRRARAAAPQVALVVLTGWDNESLAVQALQEGAQDYLVKGQIETRGLMRALRYAIERKAMEVKIANDVIGLRSAEHERHVHAQQLETSNANLELLADHLETARDQAEQASRAKSRFVASISHELRTPLNGIIGYAQLLRLDGGLNALQSERVETMLYAGRHLLRMIEGVLDVAAIESGHVEVKTAEAQLGLLADGCLDILRPMADAKHLALGLSIAPDVPRVIRTDCTRLRQMLLNLLGNAMKFTVQGSVTLRMLSVADGTLLRCEVADTGPGVAQANRRLLFQRFERFDTAGTCSIEGAGLGLWLSAQIAALMGGRIGHADNPGGGSIFWLELPLDAVTSSAPAASSDAAPAPPARVLRVLVVDDIAMNRDIAGAFLRSAGHLVACLGGGLEAVTAVANTDFDVVLMDVRMPEMDGLEATRRIRLLGGARGRVPIVALTAQTFTEQVAECRAAGMDSHLAKPFDRETLLAAVANAA